MAPEFLLCFQHWSFEATVNGKRNKEKAVLRVLGDTALFSFLQLPEVHQHHATSVFPRQSHLHLRTYMSEPALCDVAGM